MEFYLIRHADPDYDNDTITEYGQQQANSLADYLAEIGIDEIYSSPLGRALATAKPLADKLGKIIKVMPWAAEVGFPVFTPSHILRGKDCMEGGYQWYKVEPFDQIPIAEISTGLFAGLDSLLAEHGYVKQEFLYKMLQPNDKKIALFAHGFVGATLLSYLFQIPSNLVWSGTELYTTGISAFRFQNYDTGYTSPRCMALNVRPHLHTVPEWDHGQF